MTSGEILLSNVILWIKVWLEHHVSPICYQPMASQLHFKSGFFFPTYLFSVWGGGGLGVGSLILPSRSWGSNTVIRLSIKHLHPLSHCTHRGFLVLGSKPEMLSFLRLPNEVSSSAHPSQKSSLLHFFNSYMCSCTPQVSFHHLSIWWVPFKECMILLWKCSSAPWTPLPQDL